MLTMIRNTVTEAFACRFGCGILVAVLAFGAAAHALTPIVEIQEDVYTFTNPDNGSGPLWSFGCTSIVRAKDGVYVSQMETGEGVEPLCNTRWRLLRRDEGAWTTIAMADRFRQREPVSIALTDGATLNLYVNDSLTEPGTRYQACFPHILRIALDERALAVSAIVPNWGEPTTFTDHSYRGYASDRETGSLLMLNIDAKTSKQHYALIDKHGVTRANGAITFPIRAAYPQVALNGNAAHVLAIGDIVEPNETWRAYKGEQTGRSWDYVFRRLFYVRAADLTDSGFGEPIEIANRDSTCGHIRNQDLAIGESGEAYLLYTAREVQNALIRDRFFPEASVVDSLYMTIINERNVGESRVVFEGSEENQPTCARFHRAADGKLFILANVSGDGGGNVLIDCDALDNTIEVPFDPPFKSFMLATERAGNARSDTIDILGHRGRGDTLAYGRVRLERE